MMKAIRLFALIALLLPAIPASAQGTTATVSGTVTGATGAAVPGARVTVINHDTRVVAWDGVTNPSVNYVAPEIPLEPMTSQPSSEASRRRKSPTWRWTSTNARR